MEIDTDLLFRILSDLESQGYSTESIAEGVRALGTCTVELSINPVNSTSAISSVFATPTPSPKYLLHTAPDQAGVNNKSECKDYTIQPEVILQDWNHLAGELGLTRIRAMTGKRRGKLKTRAWSQMDWLDILHNIRHSQFLQGRRGKWRVTLDWLLENDTNWMKVAEGSYQDTEGEMSPAQRLMKQAMEAENDQG